MNLNASSFLQRRWLQLTSKYSHDEDFIMSLLSEIELAYNSPQRHYHNLSHVMSLLSLSAEFSERLHDQEIVDFAIFYHDVVYDVSLSDNEERSAAIAQDRLITLKMLPENIDRIVQYINASKSHRVEDFPRDGDLAWFLDFDMGILGSDWITYSRYSQDVRKEYIMYPDNLYAAGRRQFLLRTISRPFIFNTPHFQTTYEEKARLNMDRELNLLSRI